MAPPRIFDAQRRESYLDTLATLPNLERAALRAGVHPNTVYRTRVTDPAFDRAVRHAYELGQEFVREHRMGRELMDWHAERAINPYAACGDWLLGELQRSAACKHQDDGADQSRHGDGAGQPRGLAGPQSG